MKKWNQEVQNASSYMMAMKKESLDKFEDKSEGEIIGYVPFPFIAPSQKELNHPTDMDKGTRNLNHFV